MARPIKKGLEYFPLDVALGDNVELLEAECGLTGFAILVKLWQKIYANGYFVEWEDDNALLFSRKINAELMIVNDVVNTCFKRNLFNKAAYDKHKILTSEGIQKRYLKVCSDARRKNYGIENAYKIVNAELIVVNTEETTHGVGLTPEESTQSKVKKSKVKESIYIGDSQDESLDIDPKKLQEDFFKKCWAMYPEKKGIGSIKDSHKAMVYKLGEEFVRCIERYILTVETKRENGFTQLNYQHGSTFFKSGYADFLDAHYVPVEKKSPKPVGNGFHNFSGGEDEYSDEELEVILGSRALTRDGRDKDAILSQ